jgi:hypothetical protein
MTKLIPVAEGAGVGVKDEALTALVRVFQAAYNAKRTELRALPNPYRHDTESDMADHAGLRAVLARYGTHPRPIPVAERLEALEALSRDAVSALRYIEQQHGRLYGVGWDRVFDAAAAIPLPAQEA